MQIFIDLDSRQAVSSQGDRTPISAINVSSQDTLETDVYFVRGGLVVSESAGVSLKLGVFTADDNTLVSLVTAFTAQTDANAAPYWQGFLNLNTTQMGTKIGALPAGTTNLVCNGEARYVLPDGELIHTIYLPFTVFKALLTEAGVTPPNVGGTYPDVSQLVLIGQKGSANGVAELDPNSKINPAELPLDGTSLVVAAGKASANLDNSTVVLNGGHKISVPIDGASIVVAAGKVQSGLIITSLITSFVQPAAGVTVTANIDTTKIQINQAFFMPVGGYYVVKSFVDATHAVILNDGDAANALSGATIAAGTLLYPAPEVSSTPSPWAASSTIAAWSAGTTYTGSAPASVATFGGGSWVAVAPVVGTAPGSVIGQWAEIAAPGSTGTAGAPGSAGPAPFSTLASSFFQPAVGSTVNATVQPGGGVFYFFDDWLVIDGGYYTVSSIAGDILTILNTGLGSPDTVGSTVGAGKKVLLVGPQGTAGPTGSTGLTGGTGLTGARGPAGGFSTLSASFVQPAVSSSVAATVQPGDGVLYTAGDWLTIFGGYYTITSIATDTLTIVNTGLGSPVAVAGTVPSGKPVIISGPQGPAGAAGGVTSLTDAETTAGLTLIGSSTGQVKRVIAGTNVTFDAATTPGGVIINAASTGVASLTDSETTAGVTLIGASTGGVKRIIAGTGVTLDTATTPGGVIVNTSGGSSSGSQDPENGLELTEHFFPQGAFATGAMQSLMLPWNLQGTGSSLNSCSDTTLLSSSSPELSAISLINSTATGKSDLSLGNSSNGLDFSIPIALGPLTYKAKIAIDALGNSTDAFVDKVGIFRYNNFTSDFAGFFFEYNFALRANWSCGTATGTSSVTRTDSGVVVAASTWYKFKILVNAAWTSAQFFINNTLVSTITTTMPVSTDLGVSAHFQQIRSAGTTSRSLHMGYFYMLYPFTN